MPIRLIENIDSRETDSFSNGVLRRVSFHYTLEGTSSDYTARLLIENSVAELYRGLKRSTINLSPVWVDDKADAGVWEAIVDYVPQTDAAPEIGDSTFSFDTAGGTQHLTQSILTRHEIVPDGEPAISHKGAIGVSSQGVEGVDITVPIYNFSETHWIADSTVTDAYKGKLFRLTGKTNLAPFKGCERGECLFLGASGSKRGDEDWEVTFRCAGSPNMENIPIGATPAVPAGIMTVPDKRGWEYLWVQYAEREAASGKVIVSEPIAAFVEQVYYEGDLADLGIGT